MKLKTISAGLFALCLAGLALAARAEEGAAAPAAGNGMTFETKLKACGACHGENGDKPLAPDYPILAGQHADYLAQALKHYRDGRRTHPIMSMQVQALGLTDGDIGKLAAYFAAKPGVITLVK